MEANPLPTPPPLPRGRGRLFLAVAMAAGILLAAQGLVVAFELLGQSWASPFATFRVNPNFPQEAGGSAQQQVDAIRCGASAWESEGRSNFRFVYQGTTSIEAVNNLDGVNALFWSATNPAGGLALASTFFTWDANDHYIGFDVVYWGANDNGPLIWNGLGDPQPGEYDIRAVATHELGHTFGLGHTSIAEATMYTFYGGVGMRTLHPDDIEGVQFLYGAGAQPPPQPSINDILPPVGPDSGGNEVVIAGESFSATEDTLLTIDGAALAGGAFEVESCGTVRIFAMPPHDPGPVAIGITNELGSVLLAGAYLYQAPPPEIVAITPPRGPVAGGTEVSVWGYDFTADATVIVGGAPLENQQLVDGSKITGTTPPAAAPGAADVFILQDSGSDLLPGGFLYGDDILRIPRTGVSQGSPDSIVGLLGSHALDLAAFNVTVDFDGVFADVVEVSVAGTVAESADFVAPVLDNDPEPAGGFWSVAVLMDLSDPPVDVIPAGENQPFLWATYAVDPLAPVETIVDLAIIGASLAASTGAVITPATIDGALVIGAGAFTRGDGNSDGVVNLADPIFNLVFQFQGTPATCEDALDTNDDGQINVADPIWSLSFQFTGGPPPPEPFLVPALDPTPDGLGCDL